MWRAIEFTDDDVTAFGAANESARLAARLRQDIVDPWTRCVDDHARSNHGLRAIECVPGLYRGDHPALDIDPGHLAVGMDIGSGGPCRQQVFEDQPFDEGHLSVVIAGCAEQAGLRKARILLHDFRAAQHVVIRHGLADREQIISEHTQANDERAAPG